jgi:uncharacterized protein YbaR (Trm112 family)
VTYILLEHVCTVVDNIALLLFTEQETLDLYVSVQHVSCPKNNVMFPIELDPVPIIL